MLSGMDCSAGITGDGLRLRSGDDAADAADAADAGEMGIDAARATALLAISVRLRCDR